MTVTILCFLHRTPGTTMSHFINYYETKHMRVIFDVTDPLKAFPLRHTRHYIHRTTASPSENPALPGIITLPNPPPSLTSLPTGSGSSSSSSSPNAATPATLFKGEQNQVEFDCISEIEFADEEHFARFFEAISSPEGKARLDEDQRHFQVMDRHFVVLQGEKRVTTRDDFGE